MAKAHGRAAWGIVAVTQVFAWAGESRSARSTRVPTTNPGPSQVTVSERQLIVRRRNLDGSLGPAAPYVVRGVAYSPARVETNTSGGDPNNANIRRQEFSQSWQTDIPLLKAMNVTTVKLYIDPGFEPSLGPQGLAMLDAFYANDIMVIMTVDDASHNIGRLPSVVDYYKNHPAILFWLIGNEWNVFPHYYNSGIDIQQAALWTEEMAQMVKAHDAGHPVATSYGDIAGTLPQVSNLVNTVCPSVDIWGVNIYRGATFGKLFTEWASVSSKPLFIGEFGIDALDSQPDPDVVDEPAQADWDVRLWNHIFWNLSALNPHHVVLGGTVFEWNDEYWKAGNGTPGVQDHGGWFKAGAFPDGVGNEEFFGLVGIDRLPRQAYFAMQAAFAPGHVPPFTLEAISKGGNLSPSGAALIVRGTPLFEATGGNGGARGFNIVVLNSTTLEPVGPASNFDIYLDRQHASNPRMDQLVERLNSVQTGDWVLITVGDEAGLNEFPPNQCQALSPSWVLQGKQALQALGSTQIANYCYRDSWSMIVRKGFGPPCAEQLSHSVAVTASCNIAVSSPLITNHPDTQIPAWAGSAQFAVNASGFPSLLYRWQFSGDGGQTWTELADGAKYSGTHSATLTVTSVVLDVNGGRYRCVLYNGVGAVVTTAAKLTAELVRNGTFTNGEGDWQFFASPTPSYMSHQVAGGALQFSRQGPPPGTSNQATAFQPTGAALPSGAPVVARFDLRNTSTTRMRVSVLVLEGDFSDLFVCTYWLPPQAPSRTYQMRTHTTKEWTNADIHFYAATADTDGFYEIDNVSVQYDPDLVADRTECIDPTVPAPVAASASQNLLTNPDFDSGPTGWSTFQIESHVVNGVFEFLRPQAIDPAGVVLQPTNVSLPANEILSARVDLGNSSIVRKRVTILLHDLDFSDLSACTLWLPPGLPLTTYEMRAFTTKPWSNATISIYAASSGPEGWTRLDNVRFHRIPALSITGTSCFEFSPGPG